MKNISAAGLAALNSNHFALLVALEMELSDSYTVRVHSGIGEKTIEGETYTGVGSLGTITPIKQEGSAKPSGVSVELSVKDQTLLNSALMDNYQGRPASIKVCFLDVDTLEIFETRTEFTGKVNIMNITSGSEGKVSVKIDNRMVDWKRVDNSRYTQEDYERGLTASQLGDEFFSFINQVIDKQIEFTPYQNWRLQ